MADYLSLTREDRVATITIDRSEKRNAVDYRGWLALKRLAEGLASDDEVRVVVLTGSGDTAFSAGADIADFERYRSNSTDAKVYAAAFDGALDAIEALPKPTVSMIKGFCIGGGCELSMATDIRVAADNSRFGIPVARLGILVGYTEMRRLANLVGPGNAAYILLSGRRIDASEAMRIGLVNSVLPLAEIDGYVQEMAAEMATLAPLSQSGHKEILRTVLGNPGLSGMTDEQAHFPFGNFDTEDFREGRRAFLERRPPRFTGK